tara:strand:+ start:77398 stop:78246 length:849 start_codon:yes stop_codon:yes gene_type:complete
MSARLADIEARRENIADLSEIVGALKAIAANRMMQGESALASIRAYADSVEEMLSTTLIDRPLPQARATDHTKRGLILFSGEYGFTGAFTEKLIDDLVDTVTPDDHVFVVGQRGAIFVRERNIQPDWETPMATRIQSVSETAHRLTGELFRCIYQGEINAVSMIYAKHQGGGLSQPTTRALFPLDLQQHQKSKRMTRPLMHLDPEIIISRITEEYIFAILTLATMESLVSENGARLVTMQQAHQSIENKLEVLGNEMRVRRQDEITTEILDIVTGAEASLRT